MLKILFVVGEFPSYSETFIVSQINDLLSRGHEVSIYAFNKGVTFESEGLNKFGLTLRTRYPNHKISMLARVWRKFKSYFFKGRVYQQVELVKENEDYDIIHCHFANNAKLFYDIYLRWGLFSRSRKICTFHGYDVEPAKLNSYKKIYSSIFEMFDVFTYNSRYLGDLVSNFPIAKHKLVELPVGFSTDFIGRYRAEEDTKGDGDKLLKIVYCGRLLYLKGVMLLPEISKKLVDLGYTNIQFHVIGNGELFDDLQNVISVYGLEQQFVLYKERIQEEVFRIMSQGNLFLLPGLEDRKTKRAETQGLVIQEAQFLGLPVLVSDAGGARYGLIDGETGFVVPQGDIEGFVDRILYFYENPDAIEQFSKKSHTFASTNYSSSVLGDRLLAIYQ